MQKLVPPAPALIAAICSADDTWVGWAGALPTLVGADREQVCAVSLSDLVSGSALRACSAASHKMQHE
jgi:hypothetical protein